MKYTIKRNCTFGWDFITYDTETMTRIITNSYGAYGSKKTEKITEKEMRQFINDRELAELRNFRYEMAKLQQEYDKKFAEIKNFKKALDNR